MRNLSESHDSVPSLMAVNPNTKVLQEVEEPGKESVRGESFIDSPFTEEEEVEEGRAPRTRKCPEGMNAEELRMHSLTHIPYHPGCKCCVAGRKRDHKHPRRPIGLANMQAELDKDNGASICADYFFPRDGPGKDSVTAIAICDFQSQFLAGHVVESKGASADNAVKQVLRDLRNMGAVWRCQSPNGPGVGSVRSLPGSW